jgi:hypothetical protein
MRAPTDLEIYKFLPHKNTFPGGKVAPKATDEGTGSPCYDVQDPILHTSNLKNTQKGPAIGWSFSILYSCCSMSLA